MLIVICFLFQVPGIYNSPFKPYPDEMEFVLRKVKPHPPEKAKPKRDNRSGKIIADSPPLPLTEPLPPIGQKLQVSLNTSCLLIGIEDLPQTARAAI